MIKILFYSLVISLVLISCKKEGGDLVHHSDTFPVYNKSVLETVWKNKLVLLEEWNKSVFYYALVDDLMIVSTGDFFYAVSVEDGELMWIFDKKIHEINILTNFSVSILGDNLYILNKQTCNAAIAVLNKLSGELVDRLVLSELSGIEGGCLKAFIAEDQIFFSTQKSNSPLIDHFNYSFFLYQYDLNSGSSELLYFDSVIYNSHQAAIKYPEANYENTSLYFSYTGIDSGNYKLRVVEIPITGGEANLVISKDMNGKPIQTSNPFVIKDQILLTSFHWFGPYSILAFDLSNDAKIIWGRHVAKTGNSILNPFEHMGDIYFQSRNNPSSIQKRDLQSGQAIWSRSFRNYSSDLITIDGLPIGIMKSGSSKNIGLIDLNTGSLLMALNIVEISNIQGDFFLNAYISFVDDKKLIIITNKGKMVCYELPF